MAQPAYSVPPRNRPLGVSIIAVLLGLYGLLTFIGGLLVVVLSNYGLVLGGTYLFGLPGTLIGVVLVLVGLIELGVAVGLWHLRMWALVLAVLVLLYDVASPLFSLLVGRGVGSSIVGFVIAFLLLVYLIAVRKHFR
jgi:hypothetical protein